MTDRAELERLRAEARRKTKNMTNKISRVKSQSPDEYHRVYLVGTGWDFRKSQKDLKSMNAATLKKYIRDADTFLSRKTQFIAAGGQPLLKSMYEEYQRNEAAYNRQAMSVHEYGEQYEMAKRPFEHAKEMAEHRAAHPFSERFNRSQPGKIKPAYKEVSYFYNQNVLKNSNERMKKRSKSGYDKKVAKDVRSVLKSMGINTSSLRNISSQALAYAWQWGKLAHSAADWYEQMKRFSHDSADMKAAEYDKAKQQIDIARTRLDEQIQYMRDLDTFHKEGENQSIKTTSFKKKTHKKSHKRK